MLTKLKKFNFNCLAPVNALLLPLSLCELELGGSNISRAEDMQPPEPHYFPQLLQLTLHLAVHVCSLHAAWLDWLSDSLGSLRSLRISDWDRSWHGSIVERLEKLEPLMALKHLELESCGLDDEDLAGIATQCPNLVDLDVSKNDNITGVGLKALVNRLSKTIKSIYLISCERVGHDAVEWARSKGVRVRYAFPMTRRPNSGRRIQL